MTTDEILELVRALPERERLRLVERVVHDVVEQKVIEQKASGHPGPDAPPVASHAAHRADVSDDEYDAFLRSIRASRSEPWRTIH